MRESIHKYFQLGTIRWMSYPRLDAMEAVKRIARDDFFDAIEITKCGSDEERQEMRRILQQSHLKVCYGAQPRLLGPKLNPNDVDEEGRKKAEATLIEAIDEAEYFGAKGIAFLAGKWEEETKDFQYEQLLKTTLSLCAYGPAPLAAKFAADVRTKYPNFGLLVDLSHFPICHESAKDVIRTCRPYITHLHYGNAVADPDAEGYGDLHQRLGYPNSANDIPELVDFLQVLKEEGFCNEKNPLVLSMEVQPTKEEDEEIILANTKRCLRRAWARVEA